MYNKHVFFSFMPSTFYGFTFKIISRKTITMKMLLMTKVTYSMMDLSLRGKGPLLILLFPSMEICITSLHSFLKPLSSLLLLTSLFFLTIMLLPFLLLMLLLSFLLLKFNNFFSTVVVGTLKNYFGAWFLFETQTILDERGFLIGKLLIQDFLSLPKFLMLRQLFIFPF